MKNKSTSPKNWREERRMQAWKLHEKGWKQNEIAEALGVREGATWVGPRELVERVSTKNNGEIRHLGGIILQRQT